MKKFYKSILLVASLFLVCGCTPIGVEKEVVDQREVDVLIPHYEPETITCSYKANLFYDSSTNYNKELSILSLGFSLATSKEEWINKFYDDLGFKSIFLSENYDENSSEEYDSYSIGEKEYDDFVILSLAYRSYFYTYQWAANFVLGTSGNAEGFEKCASATYENLKGLISNYDKPVKIWLAGYSRAASLVNLLSMKILEDKELQFNANNLFTYCFECPAVISYRNSRSYNNVFNIYNEYDPFTKLYPEKFEMKRNGISINITNETIAYQIVDKECKPFVEGEKFKNESEFASFIFSTLTDKEETEKECLINNRSNYVTNYQAGLSYFAHLLMTLYTLHIDIYNKISEDLMALLPFKIFSLFKADKLYEFITPYLVEASMEYDEERLMGSCLTIERLYKGFANEIMEYVVPYTNNFERLVYMHESKVTYSLLVNYHETHAGVTFD